MALRPYQATIADKIVNSLATRNVGVLATGAGKTVIMADIFKRLDVPSIAIAHRQELVSQISTALARANLYHNIIAPDNVIKFCIQRHVVEVGASFYRANGKTIVAGVDTLVRRDVSGWADRVELWQLDEGHHLLPDNKWGKAVAMFPNARGIGWTATPCRADGQTLRNSYDAMHVGPSMRDLIDDGYLADYRIYGPARSFDTSAIPIGKTGDFTTNGLRTATEKADITGDIVEHYSRLAAGKRGVTFAASVELAETYAAAYRAAGVPAAAISANTPDQERADMIDSLRRGALKQLVNVDIFGEGFDLPAIECVSFARATASYPLFVQQFGRGLRPAAGKHFGIIIDHVGNVARHGLPDKAIEWHLDIGRDPVDRSGDIPIRQCANHMCLAVFESWSRECPECGEKPEIDRKATTPEQVDGDLIEYSDELLAQLRGEIAATDRLPPAHVPAYMRKNAEKRIEAQRLLRDRIADWAGYWRDIHGASDSEIYQRFFRTYGVDILTAQTLKPMAANELRSRIEADNLPGKSYGRFEPVGEPVVYTLAELDDALAARGLSRANLSLALGLGPTGVRSWFNHPNITHVPNHHLAAVRAYLDAHPVTFQQAAE